VVLAAVLLAATACGSSAHRAAAPSTTATTAAATGPALPLPASATAAATAAGLKMLDAESFVRHDHDHLSIVVRGVTLTVPAGVGIDQTAQKISPLHTHDTTGILHIEAPDKNPITLGQFFIELGAPLTATGFGSTVAGPGEELRVYVDGKVVTDAANVALQNHQSIVVWLGPAGAAYTPRTFDWTGF
jgi:hypothetical protein